jgi:hypothetical protein
MKKILFAALIAGASLTAQAQDAKVASPTKEQKQKQALSPEDRAIRQLRRMTGPAQLTKEQTDVIRVILVEREKERESIKNANAADMKKQLKALNERYEAKLKASMKPEQWQNWEKFRAEQKEKRKGESAPQVPEQDLD